ncbi:MAG: hypothetical protein AAF193_07945 [Bacteroidota bacterium]
MKKVQVGLLLILLIGVGLFFSKPSQEDVVEVIHQDVMEKASSKVGTGTIKDAIDDLTKANSEAIFDSQLVTQDYGVMVIYEWKVDHRLYLGIAGQLIRLDQQE